MKILLIEGPLLDKIGEREPEIYGGKGTREKLISAFNEKAKALGVDTGSVSDYCEGNLAKIIVNAKCDGIVINPGAWSVPPYRIYSSMLSIPSTLLYSRNGI